MERTLIDKICGRTPIINNQISYENAFKILTNLNEEETNFKIDFVETFNPSFRSDWGDIIGRDYYRNIPIKDILDYVEKNFEEREENTIKAHHNVFVSKSGLETHKLIFYRFPIRDKIGDKIILGGCDKELIIEYFLIKNKNILSKHYNIPNPKNSL